MGRDPTRLCTLIAVVIAFATAMLQSTRLSSAIGRKTSSLSASAASIVNNAAYSSAAPADIVHKALWASTSFVDGKFLAADAKRPYFSVYNPATGAEVARLPRMNKEDVALAGDVALRAFKSFKQTSANERSRMLSKMAQLMDKYQNDLAYIMTVESGKPYAEAKGEVAYAKAFFELYAEEAKRISGEILQSPSSGSRKLLTFKQPVGPSALITPWNFPSAMITRKLGPALAAGCTVVIKPSEETPLSALALCAIAQEAGVPDGVVNCLTVGREEVEEVGMALCHSSVFKKLSFTGSTKVGKWLYRECSSTVKKLSLELGGNAPFIVFDDADLDVAVAALMNSKFRNAGQTCISSNRVLVQSGVYEKFSHLLAEKVSKLHCGNGLSKETTIGPLINRGGLDKVHRQVQDCLSQGATTLAGGAPHKELNAAGGTFYRPTVLTNVSLTMLPFSEETFGPLVPLLMFETEQEAVEIANGTPYGLAAYACTRDLGRAWRLSEALEFGMVGLNEGAISNPAAPFGGVKESGLGREGGAYGLEEYLETKYVCMGY